MGRALLVLLVSLWAIPATAQTVVFERFGVKEGLPSPVIFRVEPHPETGMLWVGTLNGLVAFDGHRFKTFDFPQPVINNMVLNIEHFVDEPSSIAYYHESIYQFDNHQLEKMEVRKEDRELFDSTSVGLHYSETDRWNRHWYVSISDALFYRDSTNWQQFVWPGEELKIGYVHQMPDGPLYIGTDHGLIEKQSGKTIFLFKEELKGPMIDAICHDPYGRLWFTGGGKVYCKNGESLRLVFEVDNHSGRSLLRSDKEGQIWFLSGHHGLFLLNDTGLLMEVSQHIWDPIPLINDLNFDREGNLWIGTFGDGLYRVRLEEHHFRVPFGKDPNRPLSHVLAKSNGDIMVATFGDIYTGTKDGIKPMKIPMIGDDELVYQLLEEPDGGVLFGTSRRIGRIKDGKVSIVDNEQGCNCLFLDPKKRLWCGLFHNFRFWQNGKMYRPTSFEELPFRVNSLVTDDNGLLWMATPRGLYTFDGKEVELQTAPDSTQELVVRLMIDSKKRMWCSTRNGIRVLEQGNWSSFYKEDGLPHRQCRVFLEDRSGRIWVSTDLGLCYYGEDGRFYSVQHCFPEITRHKITALSLDPKGMILASSNQSVYCLDPNRLTSSRMLPVPHLELVHAQGELLPLDRVGLLPYKDNNLQIEFSGISFRYPEYVQCRYRLVGLNETWQKSATNQVDFRSLPPGDYRFELSTRLDFLPDWSAPASYSFSIHRPFWLEWWWWLLEGLAGLALIYLVSKWQVNRARQKEDLKRQVEQQLSDLRQQALAAMMNPHFFANVISSIQDYLHTHRKEEVEQYLTDFAHLVRLNLSLAGETDISLDEEIRRLQLYLTIEQRRFDGRFQYFFEVDQELQNSGVRVLNHLVQPLIENAIWHGLLPRKGRGTVWVRFHEAANGKIRIEVEDNGVGLSFHKKRKGRKAHNSMGLNIIRERLKVSGKSHLFLLKETGEPESDNTGTMAILELEELT